MSLQFEVNLYIHGATLTVFIYTFICTQSKFITLPSSPLNWMYSRDEDGRLFPSLLYGWFEGRKIGIKKIPNHYFLLISLFSFLIVTKRDPTSSPPVYLCLCDGYTVIRNINRENIKRLYGTRLFLFYFLKKERKWENERKRNEFLRPPTRDDFLMI